MNNTVEWWDVRFVEPEDVKPGDEVVTENVDGWANELIEHDAPEEECRSARRTILIKRFVRAEER